MRITAILLSITFFIIACSKVPLTGRRQLSLIPDNQLLSQSFTSYGNFLQENQVLNNSDSRLIKKVGNRISRAVENYMIENGLKDEIEDFKWEFNLVDSPEVNAWCMPGGKVVFYTGILQYTKNETGISTIMGHEIAHAVAQHGGERMSQSLLQQFGGVALNVALAENNVKGQQYWMAAYGAGTTVGLTLPFSRLHETEADKLGMIFMAMAGYNPAQTIEFWQRMSQGKKSSTPEFLSTHPHDDTRIKNLKEFLPEARKYQN